MLRSLFELMRKLSCSLQEIIVKILLAQQVSNYCVALHCCMHAFSAYENNRFPSI